MAVLFSTNSSAVNVVKSDFVSSDEMVDALKMYEKYGGNFTVYSVSDNMRYAKAELLAEIGKLDARLKEVTVTETLVTRLNILGAEHSAAYDHVIGMVIHAR